MALQAAGYRYVLDKASGAALEFETSEDVFVPTQTSHLLITAARQSIASPGKLLDLGCGIGVCGLALAKLGLCQPPVYLSDLSASATRLAGRNAQALNVPAVARQGTLLAPWAGERFDVIVDDVSGVCEEIAAISPWFPKGVECRSGSDGTELVTSILRQAPDHLNPGGLILFPVLSLSYEPRILEAARSVFAEVSLVTEQSWFLPDELIQRFDVMQPLLDAGRIRLEFKFGTWLWSTAIYKGGLPYADRRG